MIRWGFEKGAAYFATPAVPGMPKRVMLCVGRLDFCDSVVFDGLPTDARKGGRYDD